ncbi:MAG: prepilin-type N-terminal cleavage/methylation domain-containing protein [Nitrospirae bacterium]|nr:prepilin-type N-terminal cleavage/methylation domain-containing protein [Nitrospirota bacterium]
MRFIFAYKSSSFGKVEKGAGFTLIETIIIIAIIGIIAAVVALRTTSFKLEGAARKVAADIRYAQKLAISTQTRCGIVFSGTGYTVFENGNVADPARSPGDACSDDGAGNFVVDFNASRCSNYNGVSVSAITIAFNSIGTPVDPATGNPVVTQTVTVTYNGSKPITIEAGTGRVSY